MTDGNPIGFGEAAEPQIIVGGREQLFHLLAEAAEIEHTLMCSYLYAALSLKEPTSAGFGVAESEAVARWRKSILAVAVDEMVHLLLVANLSIAIGGRPHFSRPNFPVAPGFFPSGVVVRLEGFSAQTLDHFIYLERPRGVEIPDGAGYQPEKPYERGEAFTGLMPSLQDYRTVGRLYEAMRVNLVAVARELGEAGLFVGPVEGQVGPEDVEMNGVTLVADLKSALAAIDVIIEQGEGSRGDREDSHFHRFQLIRAEYDTLKRVNPAFVPAFAVATNPVMRRPPEPEGKVFIDHPGAARLLDFANTVYALLLRFLVQSFGRRGVAGALAKERHLNAAMGLMHVLGRSGRALATMPASLHGPDVNAGISFTMLRGVEPLFSGPAEDALLAERLNELRTAAAGSAGLSPLMAEVGADIESIAAAFSRSSAGLAAS